MMQEPEEVSVKDVLARASHSSPLPVGGIDAVSLCLEALLTATYAADAKEAATSVRALGNIEYAGASDPLFDKALSRLTVLFGHDNPPCIRRAAAEACGALVSSSGNFAGKVLPVLKPNLADGDPGARLQKLIAYGKCDGGTTEEAVHLILSELNTYPDAEHAAALVALGKSFNYNGKPELFRGVEQALRCYFHDTGKVGNSSMGAYRDLYSHDPLTAMREFYDAVETLSSRGKQNLYRLLAEPKTDTAGEEIPASKDVAFTILTQGLDDRDPEAFYSALAALTRFEIRLVPGGNTRTWDAVSGLLTLPDPEVRYMASLALLNAGVRTRGAVLGVRNALADLDLEEIQSYELVLLEERYEDADAADVAAECFAVLLDEGIECSQFFASLSAFTEFNEGVLSDLGLDCIVDALLRFEGRDTFGAMKCLSGLAFGCHVSPLRKAGMGLVRKQVPGLRDRLSELDFSQCPDLLEDILAELKAYEARYPNSARISSTALIESLSQNLQNKAEDDIIDASFRELPSGVPVAARPSGMEGGEEGSLRALPVPVESLRPERGKESFSAFRGIIRRIFSVVTRIRR